MSLGNGIGESRLKFEIVFARGEKTLTNTAASIQV